MKLFEVYKMGGPFMHIISIMLLMAFIVAGLKVYRIIILKEYNLKMLGLIRLAGSFSAAWGILSQIIGIIQALEAIRAAGDISPQLVMGGAIVSFYSTIWGLIAFLISILIYYILKEVVKSKSN